jgi:hypothetical protein
MARIIVSEPGFQELYSIEIRFLDTFHYGCGPPDVVQIKIEPLLVWFSPYLEVS